MAEVGFPAKACCMCAALCTRQSPENWCKSYKYPIFNVMRYFLIWHLGCSVENCRKLQPGCIPGEF